MSEQSTSIPEQSRANDYDSVVQEADLFLSLEELDPEGEHFSRYIDNKHEEANSFDEKMELLIDEMEKEELPWKKINFYVLLWCYEYIKKQKRKEGGDQGSPNVEMINELMNMYEESKNFGFDGAENKSRKVLHYLIFKESIRKENSEYISGYVEQKEIIDPMGVEYYIEEGIELLHCLSKENILAFAGASEETRGEKGLIKHFLERGIKIGKYLPDSLKDDEDAMSLFESQQKGVIENVSPRIRNNKEFFLKVLNMYKEGGFKNSIELLLEYSSEELRDDKEYVKEILESLESFGPLAWMDFELISERLRGDEEIGLLGIKLVDHIAYDSLSEELQRKPNIFLEAFRRDPSYMFTQYGRIFEDNIKYIEEHTKGERFTTLEYGTIWCGQLSLEEEAACIRKEGTITTDLHSNSRVDFSNKKFWKPLFLEYAKDLAAYIRDSGRKDLFESWVLGDADVMKAISVIEPKAIHYAKDRLKESNRFLYSVLKENPNVFEELPIEARMKEKVAKIAVLGNPKMIRYVPSYIGDKEYLELVEIAIKEDPSTFEFAGPLRGNLREIYRLVEEVPQIYLYASKEAQNSEEIIERAFMNDPSIISHIPEEKRDYLLSITSEISLGALKYIEGLLQDENENAKVFYNELFKEIIEENPKYLRSVSVESVSEEYLYDLYLREYEPEFSENMTPEMVEKLKKYLLTKTENSL